MAMPVKYKKKGIAGLMRDNKLIRRGLISPAIQSNLGSEEIEHLQEEIRNLKMQIEILQEGMKIIKKNKASTPQTSTTGKRNRSLMPLN